MRTGYSGWHDDDGLTHGRMTRAVRVLLIACVSVFVIQLLFDRSTDRGQLGIVTEYFGLWPDKFVQGRVWQIFTYMFLHSTIMVLHIVFNLLVLFFLGPETERTIGTRHFYVLYFLSGLLGGLGWVLIAPSVHPCVGASGAIFGMLGAFAVLYPHRPTTLLLFFVLPITMRAWVLAVGLGLVQLLMLASHQGGNIAYSVHLAGGIAGCLYALVVFRPDILARIKQRLFRRTGHLRVLNPSEPSSGISSAELDEILEKISRAGINSLSRKERTLLEKASREKEGTR